MRSPYCIVNVLNKILDLAEISRSAANICMKRPEVLGIELWALFVYSEYWMYPRVDVDVFNGNN